MTYALREALAAFRRAPLLTGMSATMIGMSLFVVGLFALAAYNIRLVIDAVESRVEVVAYLYDDFDYAAIQRAQADILRYPEVRDVRFISREQALILARDQLPEYFTDLQDNPLPASLEIALRPNQSGARAVQSIANRVGAYAFVEDVRYGSDWLEQVYLLRRAAAVATAVLGAAFAAVAALIIGAAIRLAIFARRDEIAIMRLVGATDGFIRRPFVIEGMLTGLAGGALAAALCYGAFRMLTDSLFALEWLPPHWLVIGLVAGVAFGVAASAIAVRRHLREV